jgi:Holliday junction resolvase-like predicted endonuclease
MPFESTNVKVRKNTGDLVDFDWEKFRNALKRSGADIDQVEKVVNQIGPLLHDGISTQRIYQLAYGILKKISWKAAGYYRLKKAMLELGPTGYPFEHFVSKLLEFQGYEVQVGQMTQGRCVSHEVDVVATKPGKKLMVECKYHSEKSAKSDVKVPLYIHSRFMDVSQQWKQAANGSNMEFECMLVTNSRFTQDALQYGNCVGLIMVSWDLPAGNSLRDWIDRAGYHPITVLHSLNKKEKQSLMEKGLVLCRQIAEDPHVLDNLVYPDKKIARIKKEVNSLLE